MDPPAAYGTARRHRVELSTRIFARCVISWRSPIKRTSRMPLHGSTSRSPPSASRSAGWKKRSGRGCWSARRAGCGPTRAGAFFLERAREALAQAEQSVELTRRTARGEIGSLAIGYSAPVEFRVFPRIVPAFKKLRPAVHMSFYGMSPHRQVEALRQEKIDIGFAWLPLPVDEFDIRQLLSFRGGQSRPCTGHRRRCRYSFRTIVPPRRRPQAALARCAAALR